MTARRRGVAALQLGLTGEALSGTVHDLCVPLGLKVAHSKPAQYRDPKTGLWRWITAWQWDGNGSPDLFIVDPLGGGAMWRESKGQNETLKPEQKLWLEWLQANGLDADVWRPADLYSRRIERELKAMVARRPRST